MVRLALFLMLCSSALFGGDIQGFWKTINEKTSMPQCIIAIYEYDNLCYGRIIATYDDNGNLKEDIYKPEERAPGVVGNPYYCGLDIIWNLYNTGISYKGKILDPQKGNIYNAELWTEGSNLIVRGKLLMFGRNQTWFPVEEADLPKTFKKPPLSSLVPSIPQVN